MGAWQVTASLRLGPGTLGPDSGACQAGRCRGSTGQKTTTTSPWRTATASCWPGCGPATTPPAWPPCWRCSPNTATAPKTRSRWRSRPRAACWSHACAPPGAGSTRSTRWQWPATGTGTRSPAGNPARATRLSWATCCAPTCTRTGRCPPIPSSPRPSRCWPAPRQDAVWDRTQAHNRLRSHLREYYPGFLAAFAGTRDGIMRPEARGILAAAPTPVLRCLRQRRLLACPLPLGVFDVQCVPRGARGFGEHVTVDRVSLVDVAVPEPLGHIPNRGVTAKQRGGERVPQ